MRLILGLAGLKWNDGYLPDLKQEVGPPRSLPKAKGTMPQIYYGQYAEPIKELSEVDPMPERSE